MITKVETCDKPILSILICHLPERKATLDRLLFGLIQQCRTAECAEIITEDSPRGTITTGAKRNLLLEAASGRYVAFVDDDDMVADSYVRQIQLASAKNPDCIGMVGILFRKGRSNWTFRHSITVDRWCRDKERKIYFRTPNHLNPIKIEIAKQVPFKDIIIGEDRDFSDRVTPLLKTEAFIEAPIYFYLVGDK